MADSLFSDVVVGGYDEERYKVGGIGQLKLAVVPGNLHAVKSRQCLISASTSRKNFKIGVLASKNLDIAVLQGTPKNSKSLFQIASNFHGLEQTSPHSSPESTLLVDYVHDHTQGPRAVARTMADLIFRRYLLPAKSPPSSPRMLGYTDDALFNGQWPLNMLAEVAATYGVRITSGGWIDTRNALPLVTLKEKMQGASKIGAVLVENALVTHDAHDVYIGNRDHRVHHLLTAAYDLTFNPESDKGWSDATLIAAYANTLKAGLDCKASKIFLTLVGGGVFENSPKKIYTAMVVALNTYRSMAHKFPAIYITLRNPSAEERAGAEIVVKFGSRKLSFKRTLEMLV